MRITKESMLRLARDTAAINANQDRSIVCIYLTGSLVTDDPFIGGTTDIDLFFVHTDKPQKTREIRFLSDDVSLDIAHIEQSRFQQPRHLRADAWLGPFLCAKPKVMIDTNHWFEFTEASVAAQFYRPEYVLERARPLAAAARQTWMDFHLSQPEPSPHNMMRYLDCLENAGNAVALLSGPPLAERRFLMELPSRAMKVNRPDLIETFNSLVLPAGLSDLDWTEWITLWEPAMLKAASLPDCPGSMATPRIHYYTRAVTHLSDEHSPAAAWLMMRKWTQAVSLMPVDSPSMETWQLACRTFLQVTDTFSPVWDQLDSLLDSVEETLDNFASDNGLTE
jgi:hypothetical protein